MASGCWSHVITLTPLFRVQVLYQLEASRQEERDFDKISDLISLVARKEWEVTDLEPLHGTLLFMKSLQAIRNRKWECGGGGPRKIDWTQVAFD